MESTYYIKAHHVENNKLYRENSILESASPACMLVSDSHPQMPIRFSTPERTNYAYIDWIRMVAIFTIVMVHNLQIPAIPSTVPIQEEHRYPIYQHLQSGQVSALLILSQLLRSGTLLFFVVSGFLAGKKLGVNSSWSYYQRRLRVILIPFLVAYCLYVGKSVVFNILVHHLNSFGTILDLIKIKFTYAILDSAFWFVPNYFFSLSIILLLRPYLLKPWFAAIMIAITVAYGLNTHMNWIEPRHNYAVLGYVFWLWLGYVVAKTNAVERSRSFMSTPVLVLVTAICYAAALAEAFWLNNQIAPDPLNSLRLTNQLFAISLFFLLTRVNALSALPFLNPRCESFGIYLYHMFFVLLLVRLSQFFPSLDVTAYQSAYSGTQLVALTLVRGLAVYTVTLLFVKLVVRSRFAWLMGVGRR